MKGRFDARESTREKQKAKNGRHLGIIISMVLRINTAATIALIGLQCIFMLSWRSYRDNLEFYRLDLSVEDHLYADFLDEQDVDYQEEEEEEEPPDYVVEKNPALVEGGADDSPELEDKKTQPPAAEVDESEKIMRALDYRAARNYTKSSPETEELPEWATRWRKYVHDTPPPKTLQLVYHVGPRKTATTSIQADLTVLLDQGIFKQDNFYYAGRHCRPFMGLNKRIENCTGDELQKSARRVVKACAEDPEGVCIIDEHFKLLQDQEKEARNVLISDESLGNAKWGSKLHYKRLKQALDLTPWNVTIVTGFRRFFEWLPSDIFQDARLDHPQQSWHELWSHQGGHAIELVFPDYYQHWYDDHVYTDWVVTCNDGTFPIHVLDLHREDVNPRDQMLCEALGDFMPHACQFSKEMDNRRLNDKEGVMHWFYDMVVWHAAENEGLIDTQRYNRSEVRQAFYEEHAKRNFTWQDFDRACPNKVQLAEYLNWTLNTERSVWGDEVADTRKEATLAAFEKRKEEQFFCNADPVKTLQRPEWKSFFRQFK